MSEKYSSTMQTQLNHPVPPTIKQNKEIKGSNSTLPPSLPRTGAHPRGVRRRPRLGFPHHRHQLAATRQSASSANPLQPYDTAAAGASQCSVSRAAGCTARVFIPNRISRRDARVSCCFFCFCSMITRLWDAGVCTTLCSDRLLCVHYYFLFCAGFFLLVREAIPTLLWCGLSLPRWPSWI